MKTNPDHIWQYASGIFVHGIEPRWFMWIHLIMNLCALIPFGILVENTVGSRKTFVVFMIEWLVTIILFQILFLNKIQRSAGISSIAYTFATIAFYYAYRVWKSDKKGFWKQWLAYYYVFEFFGMISLLNPLAGIEALLLHLSGVVVGVLFVYANRKGMECALRRIN